MNILPLGLVNAGSTVTVCQVCGDDGNVRRLNELGFCEGNEVTVLNSGSPCMVRLGGSKFSFRDGECANIFVKVTS